MISIPKVPNTKIACQHTFYLQYQKSRLTSATSETGEYCLNGITRGKAIEICKTNNIPLSEKDFTFDDIADCDEAFVTGTFAGIIPVSKIENRNLKSTSLDSLVNEIRHLYNNLIKDKINS